MIDIIGALVATVLLIIVGIPLLILIGIFLVIGIFVGLLCIGIDKMIKLFQKNQETV